MHCDMNEYEPVFYDPARARWPRVRRGAVIFAAAVSFLALFFIGSVVVSPTLDLLTPYAVSDTHLKHAPRFPTILATDKDRIIQASKKELLRQRKEYAADLLKHQSSQQLNTPVVIGYFVNWDDSSLTSLKSHLADMDMLVPEWLHLSTVTGDIAVDNESYQDYVTSYIRARNPNFQILPLINNYNGNTWETEKLGKMLENPAFRRNVVSQLLEFVQKKRYGGVSLDFENIASANQKQYASFVEELVSAFHAANLKVLINVPADDSAYDYTRLATAADFVVLMMYDEHASTDSAGPISGIDWFTTTIAERAKQVPKDKLIVALGNYSYDWPADGSPAKESTFEEALLTAHDSSADITVDPVSLSPTFSYADEANNDHTVWIQDSVTAFNQYRIAGRFSPRGVALWRLGSEDSALWTFFGTPFDTPYKNELVDSMFEKVTYGYDLDYEGSGEILQLTGLPSLGKRAVTYDPSTGLIESEKYLKFPTPYTISRIGAANHKIALTFDDGPDPVYTNEILDVLKAKHVPGTFFVIGENADRHSDILLREFQEGHEIGNHTFTHPDISGISQLQLRLELNSTERLLESVLGRQSLLFRPPFAYDAEPTTPDQMSPVVEISHRGYLLVGMQIDPNDWQSPPAEEIVRRVVSKAETGTGNIVLLHDSGGEREETVKALPQIISQLRERGYEFVTVSALMGKTRDEVMPPISYSALLVARVNAVTLQVVRMVSIAVEYIFIIGLILAFMRLLFVGVLACIEYFSERNRIFNSSASPSVAVVIAAYNEAKVIVQTVHNVLSASHGESFQVIVIDDGSTDGTSDLVTQEFANDSRVQVHGISNSGKAAALNYGISKTAAEVIITLDADTIFTKDTMSNLVRHFSNPKIGAVAGNAKVGNRINMLTRFQALEYITSQNFDRRAFSLLNCITVVPGAVGAWRRSAILEAGGFQSDTLAEDCDLTIAIRKRGYRIAYEDEAIGLTEAPDTVRDLIRQRHRWTFGSLQAVWKNRDVFFRRRYGTLGFVALPNVIIFQVVLPLISPFMDLVVVIVALSTVLSYLQHPVAVSGLTLMQALFYYGIFLMLDLLAAGLAFALERHEKPGLLIWVIMQRFYYRQLIYFVVFTSVLSVIRGQHVGWRKGERKATVKDPALFTQ